MSALDPLFADAFGDKGVRRTWFAQTIANVLAATLLGTYADFGEMQRAALEMTAKRRGVAIDPERVRRILRGALALPAHGDVHAGLASVARREEFVSPCSRTAPQAAVAKRNSTARGSGPYFETDPERRHRSPLQARARAVCDGGRNVSSSPPHDMLFVAAHDWDVTGARNAGYRTAFVARHGTSLNPAGRAAGNASSPTSARSPKRSS